MNRRVRRAIVALLSILVTVLTALAVAPEMTPPPTLSANATGAAVDALQTLDVKGRAPKTGYERTEFGNGWALVNGCDTRNIILYRDLKDTQLDDECRVLSGVLQDPFTGQSITFSRTDSDIVQVDHIVALSDAWQKGAQQLSREQRIQLANDPLELLAVSGAANQEKGDGDAATWLPDNVAFRCDYVSRQIAVKKKYNLWVTPAEKEAMLTILAKCPGQQLPGR